MVKLYRELRPTMGSEGVCERIKGIACPKVSVRKAPASIRPELVSESTMGVQTCVVTPRASHTALCA